MYRPGHIEVTIPNNRLMVDVSSPGIKSGFGYFLDLIGTLVWVPGKSRSFINTWAL